MSNEQKYFLSQSDDEDSHNYVDDESEAFTMEEESEIYEYSYTDVIFDFLYSKRVIFSIISVVFSIIGFLFWNTHISVTGTIADFDIRIGSLSFLISAGIIFTLIFEFFINKFSLSRLRNTTGSGALWYYMNELSFYISFIVTIICTMTLVAVKYQNFYFKNAYDFQLWIYDFLKIIIATTVVLAAMKMLARKVALGFNYNIYISRIKKCILFDYFINMIAGSDYDDDEYTNNGQGDTGRRFAKTINKSFSNRGYESILFQKKWRSKSSEDLSLGAKRILLKEFQDLINNTVSYSGNLPTILGKIRRMATHKANKITRKLIRKGKAEKMGDLSKFFTDQDIFEYFLKQLNLNKEEKIDKNNILKIIEKAYRERYVIYKSTEQLNAAIERVLFCAKIAIFFYAIIFTALSTNRLNDRFLGVISTLFGVQIFNKIISDHVINSIIFLFIIHPYDIGDRILIKIDGVEENLVVAELNVFSTLFFKWDGTSVFIPNHILHNTPLINLRKSGSIMETHSIQVNSNTETSKIYSLKQMLVEFVKLHSEIYTDYILVNYERIEDSGKLHIKVLMQYQTNSQNYEWYLKKRSYFLIELNRCLQALKIKYDLPVRKIKISKRLSDKMSKIRNS